MLYILYEFKIFSFRKLEMKYNQTKFSEYWPKLNQYWCQIKKKYDCNVFRWKCKKKRVCTGREWNLFYSKMTPQNEQINHSKCCLPKLLVLFIALLFIPYILYFTCRFWFYLEKSRCECVAAKFIRATD